MALYLILLIVACLIITIMWEDDEIGFFDDYEDDND